MEHDESNSSAPGPSQSSDLTHLFPRCISQQDQQQQQQQQQQQHRNADNEGDGKDESEEVPDYLTKVLRHTVTASEVLHIERYNYGNDSLDQDSSFASASVDPQQVPPHPHSHHSHLLHSESGLSVLVDMEGARSVEFTPGRNQE